MPERMLVLRSLPSDKSDISACVVRPAARGSGGGGGGVDPNSAKLISLTLIRLLPFSGSSSGGSGIACVANTSVVFSPRVDRNKEALRLTGELGQDVGPRLIEVDIKPSDDRGGETSRTLSLPVEELNCPS